MNSFNSFLLQIALIVKVLYFPRFLKYFFFLLIKRRNIFTYSKIKISGALVCLNLGDFIDFWVFMDGGYEEKWIRKTKDLVKGRVFIDVGANIGIYSLSLYKDAKKIFAFEPEKENYVRLGNNIKINDISNVQAYRIAIFSKSKRNSPLFISEKDRGWHSLRIRYNGGRQLIDTVTLDEFVPENKIINLGLIKIDVEGAELDVLRGCRIILKSIHPALLIEFNKPFTEKAGYSTIDIYDFLIKKHYLGYRLDKSNLIRVNRTEVFKIYNENLLFLHNETDSGSLKYN